MLLALAVAVVALAAPASARAGEAMLWACHGPAGQPLPLSFEASGSAGAFVRPTSLVPCQTPGDTIKLGFDNVAPPEGSTALLRVNTPGAGTTLEGVWLGRSVTGPGYFARTSSGELESLPGAGTLGGVFSRAATGSWVELGLRCAAPGCDMTGAAVDFSSIALLVRDDLRPSFTVDSLPSYAAGVFGAVIDARDDGIGLAQASATLGGVPMGSTPLGLSNCRELSPGNASIDLPLADDCPSARRVALALDSRLVPDGLQRLELTVTDAAGNVSAQGLDLRVINHPPVSPTPVPTSTPTPTATPRPTAVPNTAVLHAAKRYRVSKRGALTAEASCPARAAKSCSAALTLRAKLPGRKRAATIASGRKTVKPGATAKVTLKLSSAARRALARRSLTATLTLTGAKPATVKLVRSG